MSCCTQPENERSKDFPSQAISSSASSHSIQGATLADVYFTLHDPSLPADEPPLFRSEIVRSTLNPTWEGLSLGGVMHQHTDMDTSSKPIPPLPSSAYHLIVRLWSSKSVPVMEFPLNLLHLGYIPDITLSFPADTLLLQLIDGWYEYSAFASLP